MVAFLKFVGAANPIHLYVFLAFVAYLWLSSKGKLPQVESIRKLTSMLDDRGGNILVLGLLTSWFFVVTVKLFYHAMGMISSGQIKTDDAILLMALNTVSGTFAGTCFGALLKTMNGSMTVPPPQAITPTGMPLVDRRNAPETPRTFVAEPQTFMAEPPKTETPEEKK